VMKPIDRTVLSQAVRRALDGGIVSAATLGAMVE